MNKAITDGLVLMPPPFEAGLAQWSSGDGTAGSPTYQNNGNAAFVPADQDFGGCLEVLKTDNVQKIRNMGDTPILPGCYLQVTVRLKAVSGPLPAVRIAAWAGNSSGAVAGVPTVGPETQLDSYGTVVTVSGIVATSNRSGVDFPWGPTVTMAHLGLDLTGPTGGVVRIDDIEVVDLTSAFLRDMMDWVDVRDFGAIGDGVTDDTAAFLAADAAAGGGHVLVSAGTYLLAQDVTFDSHVRFEGTVTMPTEAILTLARNFDLPAYITAFGNEELAFRKAFQSLLNNADHESLDMGGRRISVTGPIDMQAAVPNRNAFAQRRVVRNGQLRAEDSGAWTPTTTTSQATYDPAQPFRLSGVTNIANVPVGALVTGAGVGREVYVREVNVAAQTLTLSQSLHAHVGTQTFTFTRFKFLMDFSGFSTLQDLEITDVEFQCGGLASGAMLAVDGSVTQFRDCVFNRPGHRGIASPGEACQGLLVDRCKFLSDENQTLAQNRQTIAISAHSNDVKLRNNRSTQFLHFAVLSGSYLIIANNHFFQGDSATNGARTAGIVLTQRNCHATITGNYIDNCFIEWTNEREPDPVFSGGFGFSGLSVNDNIMLASSVASWFAFLVIKPFGSGHFVNGLSVTGNTFRAFNGTIDRVERVDTSFAGLDLAAMRKIDYVGNTFHNVITATRNPLWIKQTQAIDAQQWTVDTGGQLPFAGQALEVDSVMARGPIRSGGAVQYDAPYSLSEQGPNKDQVMLVWPALVRGTVKLAVRSDR